MFFVIICIWYINVYPYIKIKSVVSRIREWNISQGFRQKNIVKKWLTTSASTTLSPSER